MTDIAERSAERALAAEGTIEAFLSLQRKKCRRGEHMWAKGWSSTYPSYDGSCWEVPEPQEYTRTSFYYREFLTCPARQRKIEWWIWDYEGKCDVVVEEKVFEI